MASDFVGLSRPAFDNVATKSGIWDSLELLSLAKDFVELGSQAQETESSDGDRRVKTEMVEILGKMIQRTSRIQRYSIENSELVARLGVERYEAALKDLSKRIGQAKRTARLLKRFGLTEEHLNLVTELFSDPPIDYISSIGGNPFQALGEFSSSLGVMVEVIPRENLRKSNPVNWHTISVSLGITTAGLVLVFLSGALDTSYSETMQTLGTGMVASGTTVLTTELSSHKK